MKVFLWESVQSSDTDSDCVKWLWLFFWLRQVVLIVGPCECELSINANHQHPFPLSPHYHPHYTYFYKMLKNDWTPAIVIVSNIRYCDPLQTAKFNVCGIFCKMFSFTLLSLFCKCMYALNFWTSLKKTKYIWIISMCPLLFRMWKSCCLNRRRKCKVMML